MRKLLLLILAMASMQIAMAQKLDIDFSGKGVNEVLEPGYQDFRFGRVAADTSRFAFNETDSFTIMTYPIGENANGIATNWQKEYCKNTTKLCGDGGYAVYINEQGNLNDVSIGSAGLKFVLRGFPAGKHTVMAYHNHWNGKNGWAMAPFDVVVDGNIVSTGNTHTNRAATPSEAAITYVSFVAEEGKDVVLEYVSRPEDGASYNETTVIVNALVFDEVNLAAMATDPVPENRDMHAAGDAENNVVLSWKAAESAVQHQVYIGTESGQLSLLGIVTDPTIVAKDLYSLNTYYWRVDEVDGSGNVTEGEEWIFRPRQLAFQDAQGFGKYAIGGRGGDVYHVTCLEDKDSVGCFRYGLTSATGPRTIVFDISGIIALTKKLPNVPDYVTVAAQTAPEEGICFRGMPIYFGNDNIGRFVRMRRGYGGSSNWEGLTMNGVSNSILDHTSISWTVDVGIDTRKANNITFQRSMIAECLGMGDYKDESDNHGYAGTIGGIAASYHHNLLAHNYSCNFSMQGGVDNNIVSEMDIYNNVCYNWNQGANAGSSHMTNFVGNLYRMGTDTESDMLFKLQFGAGQGTQQAFVKGNQRMEISGELTDDALENTYCYTVSEDVTEPGYDVFTAEPLFDSEDAKAAETATDAFKNVCSDAGASMPFFDNHDQRIVKETVEGTYTYTGSISEIKGQIDREDDCGGYEAYPEVLRANDFDKDQDGIPGWFESVIGTSDEAANNNADPDHDGWTQLEDYLEFIAHPYLTMIAGEQASIDVAQYFRGFTKTPVFTVVPAGFVQGGYSGSASATIDGSTLTVSGVSGGLATMKVTVTDADNSTYTRNINVAVIGGASKKGDANNDGIVDVADITAIASFILGTTPEAWNQTNADANNDGNIDVADITATAGIILGN